MVERKLDGLTPDDAKRVMTPTGMSPLWILKHLGWVERGWFRGTFAGEDVEAIDMDGDNSAEFAIGGDDTSSRYPAFTEPRSDSRGAFAVMPSRSMT